MIWFVVAVNRNYNMKMFLKNCWQDLKEPISFDWNFETDVLLLITFNALHLASKRYELLKELGPGLHLKYDNRSSNFLVPESLIQLKVFWINFSGLVRTKMLPFRRPNFHFDVPKRRINWCAFGERMNRKMQPVWARQSSTPSKKWRIAAICFN